jgi:hypothetical protein
MDLEAGRSVLLDQLNELRQVLAGARKLSDLSPGIASKFGISVNGGVDRFYLRGVESRLQSLIGEVNSKLQKVKELLASARLCSLCNGSGSIVKESVERDPDNMLVTHTEVNRCSQCGGSGKTESDLI